VGMGIDGRFCTRWVGLHVTAKEMKLSSYLDVVINPFP
jgi:hypothetical protein